MNPHAFYAIIQSIWKGRKYPYAMKKHLLRFAVLSAASPSFSIPLIALAQAPPPLPTSPANSVVGVMDILCRFVGWFFAFLIVIAVIFVLVAAWKYLTAAGDPEKVSSANRSLIYAAIAVLVALIARGIPAIVSSFAGGGIANFGCP